MAHLHDPYPDVELAAPPLSQPIRQPRLVYSAESKHPRDNDEISPRSAYSINGRSKRESYNLSGSTFLITASGMILKLPIPSNSELDPLNWGRWKSAGAMFAVALYFTASSTAVQAPSVILPGIAKEFGAQVRFGSHALADGTDVRTGCQAMDDGIRHHRTNALHRYRRPPMASAIVGTGQTAGVPSYGAHDAFGGARCWALHEFPHVVCLCLSHRSGTRVLGHFGTSSIF